jgi:hypothetical protein
MRKIQATRLTGLQNICAERPWRLHSPRWCVESVRVSNPLLRTNA